MPRSNIVFRRYQPMSEPVWLPVSRTIAPPALRTPTPMRSQSGSVPMMMSAPSLSARSTAIFRAGAFSGLGDLTVGKRPSRTSCSGTVKKLKPSFFSSTGTSTPPVPCRAVKTILRFLPPRRFQQFGLQHHGLDAGRGTGRPSQRRAGDFALLIGGQRRVGLVFEGVDLADDATWRAARRCLRRR
jgi:hypothetical protein